MNISRRGALKVAALGAVAATGVRKAEARERLVPPEDATGMLYDSTLCIGCKACMQGCPYDALYLNEETGTAQKCHFCAHRTEIGLAPACAVVCPTEAIVPGDFHDPESAVSRLKAEHELTSRKPEG